MSIRQIIFLIGFFIIILPFLGIPFLWKQIAFILVGISLIALSFRMSSPKMKAETFEEGGVDLKHTINS